MRRFATLTNAFSKKAENLARAVSLLFYKFSGNYPLDASSVLTDQPVRRMLRP